MKSFLILIFFPSTAWSLSFDLLESSQKILGQEGIKWLIFFAVLIIGFILRFILEWTSLIFQKRISSDSLKGSIFQAIQKPSSLLVISIFWLFCLHKINFSGVTQAFLITSIKIISSTSLIWMAYRFSDVLTNLFKDFAKKTKSDLDDQMVPFISKSLKILVLILGSLLMVQNLGVNIVSLLAGLGIGGLAFALAAKDTAANLFGSIMIIFDRPFRVGDWVDTSSGEGTIQSVGFRSTQIRTFYDSIISVPNAVLANISIDNLGKRKYRRVKTNLGVRYDTDPEKIEAFCEGIKNIILDHPKTRKDYFHVVLNSYGPSSLDILVYFFFEAEDWTKELKYKEEIFLSILKLAKKLDVSFAFPSQSIYLENSLDK